MCVAKCVSGASAKVELFGGVQQTLASQQNKKLAPLLPSQHWPPLAPIGARLGRPPPLAMTTGGRATRSSPAQLIERPKRRTRRWQLASLPQASLARRQAPLAAQRPLSRPRAAAQRASPHCRHAPIMQSHTALRAASCRLAARACFSLAWPLGGLLMEVLCWRPNELSTRRKK